MHIIFNGLMMALELAAILAVAWTGYTAPLVFAAGTALLALGVGAALEIARLDTNSHFISTVTADVR